MDRMFQHRINTFMSTKTDADLIEKISYRAVILRKTKRREHFQHKRLKETRSPCPSISLEECVRRLDMNNIESVKTLRKFLCDRDFDYLALERMCPSLVAYLSQGLMNNRSELAFEVSWCFTNLALGPQTMTAQIAEYIPIFVSFVTMQKDKMLAEQGCWVLGNLAADDIDYRNSIRQVCGLLPALAKLLFFKNPSLSTVACWTLCNLIRGPNTDVSLFIEGGILVPVLELTHRPWTEDVCIEALWFLSFLTINPGHFAFETMKPELTRLLWILDNTEASEVVIPVLRIIGNAYCYYSEVETVFNQAEIFPVLQRGLMSEDPCVVRDTLWMFSNLLSGSDSYVDFFIDSEFGNDILRKIVACTGIESNSIKTETAICLYNLAIAKNCYYFLPVLRLGGAPLIEFYLHFVETIPQWFTLGLNGTHDSDMLRICLDFLCMALDEQDVPEDVFYCLKNTKIPESIQNCLHNLSENFRLTNTESVITGLCSLVLQNHFPSYR